MRERWAVLAGAVLFCLAAGYGPASADVTTDMSKGGPTFGSGNNTLTIGGMLQFRYTGDSRQQFDADANGVAGAGLNDGYSQQFAIQRLRLLLNGGMFEPWLKYKFEFELGNTTGTNDNKIKDGIIYVNRFDWLNVKMGQYKVPFSLQEITSDAYLEFVDRAITNAKFAPSRDLGFTLFGTSKSRKFGYQAAMFNGGGEGKGQDDQGLMYVARVWWTPMASCDLDAFRECKASESANDNPDKSFLHVGAGVRTGEAQRGTATTGVFENPDNESAWNFEAAWKYRRYFATGEYFRMDDEQMNPTPGPDIQSSGWHAQFGYMITPKNFEVAARYAQIDPDRAILNDRVQEKKLALSYYFVGHNLKLSADGGQVDYGSSLGNAAYPALALRGLPIPTGRRVGGVRHYTDSQYRLQMQVRF